MSRRERQQQQIASALARGHFARVLVLAREHLAEFPADDDVMDAAATAQAAWEPRVHSRPGPARARPYRLSTAVRTTPLGSAALGESSVALNPGPAESVLSGDADDTT